ncbi:hypothetical protein HMPREF9607_00072 [Cutibacterium modestum HL044PA1]|uniref:Uncharacterized protein n=1 Tax=Cutibacterium modestum HL044PA1 TaxID=765109 RepID=A0ABP2K9J7_9ACTN|nr:hypothetical protein HMPREF9607_00072 [Cutibacterium modestum HL044PA1]
MDLGDIGVTATVINLIDDDMVGNHQIRVRRLNREDHGGASQTCQDASRHSWSYESPPRRAFTRHLVALDMSTGMLATVNSPKIPAL